MGAPGPGLSGGWGPGPGGRRGGLQPRGAQAPDPSRPRTPRGWGTLPRRRGALPHPAAPQPTLHSGACAPGRPPPRPPQVYTNKVSDSVRLLWPLSAGTRQDKGAPTAGCLRGAAGAVYPAGGRNKGRRLIWRGRGRARGQAWGAAAGRAGEGALGWGPSAVPGCGDLSASCCSGASPPRHLGPRHPGLGKGRLKRSSRTSGFRTENGGSAGRPRRRNACACCSKSPRFC